MAVTPPCSSTVRCLSWPAKRTRADCLLSRQRTCPARPSEPVLNLQLTAAACGCLACLAEGVKAEEAYEKDGSLPDPASTDNPEFQVRQGAQFHWFD